MNNYSFLMYKFRYYFEKKKSFISPLCTPTPKRVSAFPTNRLNSLLSWATMPWSYLLQINFYFVAPEHIPRLSRSLVPSGHPIQTFFAILSSFVLMCHSRLRFQHVICYYIWFFVNLSQFSIFCDYYQDLSFFS